MNGFQLTFITIQDRKHKGQPLIQWLLAEARHLGIQGATVIEASEGTGQNHRLHSAHFFDLADQPLELMMAVTADQSDALFARLRSENAHVFYIKIPIEFGTLGETS